MKEELANLVRTSICATSLREARPGGLEPPAFGSEVRRSIQLSYGREEGIQL